MVEWSRMAFVFPGQGSQVVGMGRDIAESSPAAQALFERADRHLGFSLSRICFEGDSDMLNDTVNAQPALYVTSLATFAALRESLPQAQPGFVAGHSFGELTALAAAGAMGFEEGLTLVHQRGRLMKQAGEMYPGAMAAILGLTIEEVADVCQRAQAETGAVVVVANDNCPGQVVISGDIAALEAAAAIATAVGARRVMRLAVSIAAHSPLMQVVSDDFAMAVDAVPMTFPDVPVFSNLTATVSRSIEEVRDGMRAQLTSCVRWREIVMAMIAAGCQSFIEIGPKDVLSGLIRRIDSDRTTIALNSSEALKQLLSNLNTI